MCRNPPPQDLDLNLRHVWSVPLHFLLRNSVEDMALACEESIEVTNFRDEDLNDHQKLAPRIRQEVQMELEYAGVEHAGALWGAGYKGNSPVARWETNLLLY